MTTNSHSQQKGKQEGGKTKSKKRKRAFQPIELAIIHIQATFNNTLITLTDEKGNVRGWSSAGARGFKGTRKGTPFAAQRVAEDVAQKALGQNIRRVIVYVKGPGPGRETAIRTMQHAGLRIIQLRDVTPIPHNGCRPRKIRRV